MAVQRPPSLTDEFLQRLVKRVPSTSGGTWKLTEVYTGEVLVELPQSTPEDIAAAFDRARAVQSRVVAVAAAQAAQGVQEVPHAGDRCAGADRRHHPGRVGQEPPDGGRGDLRRPDGDPHYIRRAPRLLADKAHAGPVPVISGSTEIRQPKGVVGIIAPWNFPFATAISDAIPALIAGNGVV